jgi:cysteine desulfurase / selenocysteine lyase
MSIGPAIKGSAIPKLVTGRPRAASGLSVLDVERIRLDFPILNEQIHGKPLVYLDNGATSQKPRAVIEAVRRFYLADCANVHRAVHLLSERATNAYEGARTKLRKFLGAAEDREIIFVRGTTEGINLVAASFGKKFVKPDDEIVITAMEHHSNIVPWQILCEDKGAKLKVAPINDAGELLLPELERLLTPRTRMLAITHVSNALGTINPVKEIIEMAHSRKIPVLIDGAQSAPHMPVDVRALDCDFYCFSGHKLYGPTGIGVLYGKAALLEQMPPYQGGGDMISSVTFEKTTYNRLPYKFEAGTPDISGVIGLGAAVDYIGQIGMDKIATYEKALLQYATERILKIPGVRILGTAREKASLISFLMEGIHPHDIGTVLDQDGIAVRAGHHCAQPVMERFGIPATTRASFAFYNTAAEVDALVEGMGKVREVFA